MTLLTQILCEHHAFPTNPFHLFI